LIPGPRPVIRAPCHDARGLRPVRAVDRNAVRGGRPRPDTCFQASGVVLDRELKPVTVTVGPAKLRFKSYHFYLSRQPRSVFITIWEELDLDAQSRAPGHDWSRWSRIQCAWPEAERRPGESGIRAVPSGKLRRGSPDKKKRLPELNGCRDDERAMRIAGGLERDSLLFESPQQTSQVRPSVLGVGWLRSPAPSGGRFGSFAHIRLSSGNPNIIVTLRPPSQTILEPLGMSDLAVPIDHVGKAYCISSRQNRGSRFGCLGIFRSRSIAAGSPSLASITNFLEFAIDRTIGNLLECE
jgi:hypothetical protein